jgi:hypothetical protein
LPFAPSFESLKNIKKIASIAVPIHKKLSAMLKIGKVGQKSKKIKSLT